MNGQLSNRRHGRGCPLCANKVVSSTNNLAAKYPELSAEWHPSKNGNLTPDQVIAHSAQMVWWKCPVADDHEWESIVFNRSKHGNGCPACAGFIPTEGHNLAALLPELVEQWHPTKNGDLLSQQLTPSSATLIWWACPVAEDHQWQATPGARVIDMQEGTFKGCPFCANLYASTSNSLAELFPEIALEWHPTKNGELTAERVVQGSNKKYWWQCKHNPNHEWATNVAARTRLGSNCPHCHIYPRSRIEVGVAFELLSFVDFSIADIKVVSAVDNKIHQVDIKVPAWKLIIEYDGTHWHRDKIEQDTDKGLQLNQLGWQVIRIRSTELGKITANDILLPEKSMSDVKTVAEHLTLKLVELGYLQQSDYDSYQARDNLINAEKAEEYIQQLLAAKRSEDQLELFEVSPS